MKLFFTFISVFMVYFSASADDQLKKGKVCIKDKIGYTAATVMPVEMRANCDSPLKIDSSSVREGEEAEYCSTEIIRGAEKDHCKVYLQCKSDGQEYRFSVEAYVTYPGMFGKGLSAVGLGPSCQLSGVSISEEAQ